VHFEIVHTGLQPPLANRIKDWKSGSDSFTFSVTDTTTGVVSNTATVSINVTASTPMSLTVDPPALPMGPDDVKVVNPDGTYALALVRLRALTRLSAICLLRCSCQN
jgi:hypothetical protein